MVLPPGGRKRDITDLEVPLDAPQGHYVFTAYVADYDTIFDEDPFGFQVNGQGMPGYGGNQLASSLKEMGPWRVLRGWFGYNERKEGKSDGPMISSLVPKAFSVAQNYPNPFNPSTTIQYEIPERSGSTPVDLSVYYLRGRLIVKLVEGEKVPGRYRVQWDGRDKEGRRVPSGVYLYRLEAGDFVLFSLSSAALVSYG